MRPALGLLELGSIAAGVRAGDAMVKQAPVAALYAGTVHPGRYLLLVGGEVAAVEEALAAGRESGAAALYDEILIPDVHQQVVAALTGARQPGEGDAVGVVETATVAALLGAADRGVKAAAVTLRELRLADDLGGKSYCIFRGAQADVEAAVEHACEGLPAELLVGRVVVPRLHDEMLANLDAAAGFGARVRTAPGEG